MNKIGLLGFLGLLGLLGTVTANPGFYGFFGFFGFFAFFKIVPDEMFRAHVEKAALNAFITGIVLYPVFATLGAFWSFQMAYAAGFALTFAAQMVVFSLSLVKYENRGV
jgi:fatty acid desaturase